ncbi:hypothetical protein [Cohnella sp. GCM10027633]|uniref:hypothetical protein n=1 Tax=unclassified Cohnella TaxID=2636738 RepID=UPI0036435C08
MTPKLIVLSFVLFIVIGLSWNQPASALSCARAGSEYDEFKYSSIVFSGTALSSNDGVDPVRYRVERIWKGNAEDIRDGILVGNMWLGVEKGKHYLMFANVIGGRWTANLCGNSKLLSDAWNPQEQDETFGTEGTRLHDRPPQSIAWFSAVAILALAVFTLAAKRRNRRR